MPLMQSQPTPRLAFASLGCEALVRCIIEQYCSVTLVQVAYQVAQLSSLNMDSSMVSTTISSLHNSSRRACRDKPLVKFSNNMNNTYRSHCRASPPSEANASLSNVTQRCEHPAWVEPDLGVGWLSTSLVLVVLMVRNEKEVKSR